MEQLPSLDTGAPSSSVDPPPPYGSAILRLPSEIPITTAPPLDPDSAEVVYNNRGYEVCGALNQHHKPCQRIGNCPFHSKQKPQKNGRNSSAMQTIEPPKAKGIEKKPKREKFKKGWTKEEHMLFLQGLQIHGKGAWKEIGMIVKTRNPTQIQSHAQKYYLRQKQAVKNKRSIHDLTISDVQSTDLVDTPAEATVPANDTSQPNLTNPPANSTSTSFQPMPPLSSTTTSHAPDQSPYSLPSSLPVVHPYFRSVDQSVSPSNFVPITVIRSPSGSATTYMKSPVLVTPLTPMRMQNNTSPSPNMYPPSYVTLIPSYSQDAQGQSSEAASHPQSLETAQSSQQNLVPPAVSLNHSSSNEVSLHPSSPVTKDGNNNQSTFYQDSNGH